MAAKQEKKKSSSTKKSLPKTPKLKKSPRKVAPKVFLPKKEEVREIVPVEKEEILGEERYYEGVGRRKTAVARVRLFTRGEKELLVNDRKLTEYFPSRYHETVLAPLVKMKNIEKFRVLVKVKGGGSTGQAEAIRHGIARALTVFNPDFRKRLRRVGYLTRDPRKVERKKFGLRKARRAPQWQKR